MKETHYVYDSLSFHLENLRKRKIDSVDIHLLVSLGRGYYCGKLFSDFCKNFKEKLLNGSNYILNNSNKLKVNSLSLAVGDILNRHNCYYAFCEQYMSEKNINSELDIPEKIRTEFNRQSFIESEKQGREWLSANIEAVNQLIPQEYKLRKGFELEDKITTLFAGNKTSPKINCISYNYWMSHSKYSPIEKALGELCSLNNSLLERHYQHESKYFYEKSLRAGKKIKYKDLFIKQSYKYLFNETIPFILKHSEQNNILEFYLNGSELQTSLVFRGRKAQNNPLIKKYLQGPLKGADQRKFVSVKLVNKS